MKKIIYIDMDDVLCDYINAHKTAKKEHPEIEYPQSKYGFWLNLKPIKDAIETVNYLKEHFDVYILSAPSEYNPLSYTEKRIWIENHLGFEMVNRLILSPHKNLNKGDYLIDDYTEGKGQENFEGELIHFDSEKFPDWDKIKSHFSTIVESGNNQLLYSSRCVTLSEIKYVYKNYISDTDFNDEDNLYFGRILNINKLVKFYGKTLEELNENFKITVDNYINEKT